MHEHFWRSTVGWLAVLSIETEYVGHCEKLVESLDLNNYDAILACGGDGTHGKFAHVPIPCCSAAS